MMMIIIHYQFKFYQSSKCPLFYKQLIQLSKSLWGTVSPTALAVTLESGCMLDKILGEKYILAVGENYCSTTKLWSGPGRKNGTQNIILQMYSVWLWNKWGLHYITSNEAKHWTEKYRCQTEVKERRASTKSSSDMHLTYAQAVIRINAMKGHDLQHSDQGNKLKCICVCYRRCRHMDHSKGQKRITGHFALSH